MTSSTGDEETLFRFTQELSVTGGVTEPGALPAHVDKLLSTLYMDLLIYPFSL